MLDKELNVILEAMTAAELLIRAGFKNPEQFLHENWGMPTEFTPEYFIEQDERNRAATERLNKLRSRNEERLNKIRAGHCFACGAKRKA